MAKADREASFWTALMHVGLYKRNQGRMVRQLTAGSAVVAIVLAAWVMPMHFLTEAEPWLRYGLPVVLAAIGVWAIYRLVNYPPFADFLIDVEGEMAKVTWASSDEIKRATAVVLVTMATLSLVLFLYDMIWLRVLKAIGILKF